LLKMRIAPPAEQSALRPAQHLDPVDVEYAQYRAAGARHEDAVHVEAHAALARGAATAADAANDEIGRIIAASARRRDAEVGREFREILQILDPLGRRGFLRNGDDRKRRVLQVGRASFGRDNDLCSVAGTAFVRSVIAILRQSRRGDRARRDAGKKRTPP
jgi:hypothetical protein